MSQIIIQGNPKQSRTVPVDEPYLEIAEFFCDAIQGENFVGYPAAFLRVQHCVMNCHWCDSQEVWRYGNPYTFSELFHLMDWVDLPRKLYEGQRLVLTGGSPLNQQNKLVKFIEAFVKRYDFKPFIEIENECALEPSTGMIAIVDLWNNSPKLSNSGNAPIIRYQPTLLQLMSGLKNSWFKFVVADEEDWMEIKIQYLDQKLIRKDQIVLMPLGATREELIRNAPKVVEMAIRENVRYTSREHVMLWDKKTGV
jgi:7-carboxy-7-deazaguanine synthase